MADNARAQDPRDIQMWRADGLKRRGNWLYAVQCYRAVIATCPEHVPAYVELAHVYMEHEQWRAARDLLHAGLLRVGSDPLLNLHLGNVYLAERNYDKAIGCYRAALRAEPANAAALYNLGLALARQGRNAEAITSLTTLAARRPDYPGLAELLGSTYLAVGKPERALAVMLPAEDLRPDRPKLLYAIAQAFSEQGRWPEAAARLERAHAIDPDNAEVMRAYGWALFKLREVEEGIDWLRQAVETDPALVFGYLDLAVAYRDQGRFDEARAALETARRIDPDSGWLESSLGE